MKPRNPILKIGIHNFSVLIVSALLGLGSFSTHAESALSSPKYLMAGLGDSITAAALADTSTDSEWPFVEPGAELQPFSLNGIRERALSWFENKDTLSWVSGTQIRSQYLLLKDSFAESHPGVKLDVLNAAVSGAVSGDLLAQVNQVRTTLESGGYSELPYMTLLVGANDLCKNVPMDQFRDHVREIFDGLAALPQKDGQPIHILVSSVPDIPELGKSAIRDRVTGTGLTCEYIRTKILGFCERMTHWKDDAEYRERENEVAEVNSILRSEAEEAQRRHPNLETVFSDTFYRTKPRFDLLAADCFHPNTQGQKMLATELWRDQSWFR